MLWLIAPGMLFRCHSFACTVWTLQGIGAAPLVKAFHPGGKRFNRSTYGRMFGDYRVGVRVSEAAKSGSDRCSNPSTRLLVQQGGYSVASVQYHAISGLSQELVLITSATGDGDSTVNPQGGLIAR
jgi:hypothetical protein